MNITDLIPGVSQAKAIVGGIMVAGILALGIWVWRVDGLRAKHLADLQTLNAQLTAESNAHTVTLASLGQCNIELASKSAESDERAKAFDQSKADDASAVKSADARQAADKGRRDTLKQIAANSPDSGCRAPSALTDSLKGL